MTTDHLGSPRIITDDEKEVVSRHDYLAFGDEVTNTVGNVAGRTSNDGYGEVDNIRKQYTGYERDKESGLDFAQARYYNSQQGRFTSVDPLTASASIKNPQTFNRYSYVLNSPYKFVDPLGLISRPANEPWCSTCFSGWGDYDGEQEERRKRQEQQNQEKAKAHEGDEIPVAPEFTVSKPKNKKIRRKVQKIIDKLIESNWEVIYPAVKTEVASNRVPDSEVTEETSGLEKGATLNKDGLEISGKENTGTKSERLKRLKDKLKTNEDYLNNTAIAIRKLDKLIKNAEEFTNAVNSFLIEDADNLLGRADQSAPIPGSLQIRRAPSNLKLAPPRKSSLKEKRKAAIRSSSRSIYQR